MSSAVKIRSDFTPSALRELAAGSKHANRSRRLLSLAAVLEGRSREEAVFDECSSFVLRSEAWTARPCATADTSAMQEHLDEISRKVAKGAHTALVLDRAGWHTTDKLKAPRNITRILLPSRSPELNPGFAKPKHFAVA